MYNRYCVVTVNRVERLAAALRKGEKMNSEKVAISVQKSALRKQIEALEEREREIHLHEEDAHHINSNELPALKDGVNPSAVNYVAGQSKGYVDGFRAAINTIVLALTSEYREIPMTESELYMIIELGEMKERAWLKNRKDEEMLEKQGWKQESEGFVLFWAKKDHAEDEDDRNQNNDRNAKNL